MALITLAGVLQGCSASHSFSAGPLAGTWNVHTIYLTVAESGHGDFEWPIHVFCGTGVGYGPPPCDTLESNGTIHDGGHAQLTLTARNGETADGRISGSTDPAAFPDGPIQLRFQANDTLHLGFATPPTGPSPDYLCGPKTNRSLINCGA